MATATGAQRRLGAQIAANTLWSQTVDRSAHTAPARKAFLDRFDRQVDPDGSLPPELRARLAENARKAHFQRMAKRSAKARRAKAARGGEVA